MSGLLGVGIRQRQRADKRDGSDDETEAHEHLLRLAKVNTKDDDAGEGSPVHFS